MGEGTPFLDSLRERARAAGARIAFPEADDPRVAEAIGRLAADGLVRPIAVAPREELEAPPAGGWEILDPADPEVREAAGGGGDEPLDVACRLVVAGRVDGVVAGSRHTTARVVRAAIRAVGTADGISRVSSSFYMSGMARDPSVARVLTFTDAGVVPDPSARQLAEIADAASAARRSIVGDEPRVAFLSYSTRGSAEGPSVARVREAVALFAERRPDVVCGGELQADAALVPEVGERKAPDCPVAGRANVLVFPDLDAGNVAYKLVERLAGALALGPVLQGLRRPVNDVSRGSGAEEIVHVACITALMASESSPPPARPTP